MCRLCAIFFMIFAFLGTNALSDSNRAVHRSLEPGNTPPHLQVVSRQGYALGFDSKTRQPLWVAYRLCKSDTEAVCKREKCYKRDTCVGCPKENDYEYSGFDRGHMAPCEDMLYSTNRMRESFIMTNMSPQYKHVNRGVWKSIEEFVHKCARKYEEIYVVDGPYIVSGSKEGITTEDGLIAKPAAFYKVIYTKWGGGMMLAFLVENKEDGLREFRYYQDYYVRSVKQIEDLTGFSFFDGLVLSDDVAILKSQDNINYWW